MALLEAPVDEQWAEALAAAAGPLSEALRAIWQGMSPEGRAIVGDPTLVIEEKRARLAALIASRQ